MSMPNELELPGAKDFCRKTYQNPVGQSCFQGWRRKLLPEMSTQEMIQFHYAAVKEGKKIGVHSLLCQFDITNANDNVNNTKATLAKWFENTIKAMGYDIS